MKLNLEFESHNNDNISSKAVSLKVDEFQNKGDVEVEEAVVEQMFTEVQSIAIQVLTKNQKELKNHIETRDFKNSHYESTNLYM